MGGRRGLPTQALVLLLLLLARCGPSRILLSPVPGRIESLEGHARVWLTNPEAATRTKFSFLLALPDRGSIEVSNFLGQSLYRILITPDQAFLIIPAKKVYWKGQEVEIFDFLLGFRLDLSEMISLISGEWPPEGLRRGEFSSWTLERDETGRIAGGQRAGLSFRVEEFVEETKFPRTVRFEHPENSGRLRILNMGFNRPLRANAFETEFLGRFAEKTWEEILELLNHAD